MNKKIQANIEKIVDLAFEYRITPKTDYKSVMDVDVTYSNGCYCMTIVQYRTSNRETLFMSSFSFENVREAKSFFKACEADLYAAHEARRIQHEKEFKLAA